MRHPAVIGGRAGVLEGKNSTHRPMSKQDHRMMLRMAVLEPMSPVRFP